MSDVPAPSGPRRLAGADLVLRVPDSLAARWDVTILSQVEGARERALAAALGICWPRFNRRRPYGGNALTYGGVVIDALLAEGASIGEIYVAGGEALALCVEGLVNVEGAEDFTALPPE